MSPESLELGVFLDHGLYNPKTDEYYSILDKRRYTDMLLNTKQYQYDGSLDEAIQYAKKLNCNYIDCNNHAITARNGINFEWYHTIEAVGYVVTFTEISEIICQYICDRFNLKEAICNDD